MDPDITLMTPRTHKRRKRQGKLGADGLRFRKKARDMSDEEAATKLQSAWRAKQARAATRESIVRRYQRVLDEASGKYYYIDTVTMKTSWNRPPLIPKSLEEKILTPRRFREMRKRMKAKELPGVGQKQRKGRRRGLTQN